MEADCLITRTVYPVIPPKVEYSPTEKGLALQPMLTSLCDWGKKYRQP
ncbi:MAG: winged helix-turn-helix transcriptional regulator [Selenomonadaceae bacterium]